MRNFREEFTEETDVESQYWIRDEDAVPPSPFEYVQEDLDWDPADVLLSPTAPPTLLER